MNHTLAAVALTLLLTGCAAITSPSTTSSTTPPTAAAPSSSVLPPGSCHARGSGELVLPDASCTPGAINPDVTQANIASTICKRGWTKTVRPPSSYTSDLERQQIKEYGLNVSPAATEEDHLIPLELGGAPKDPHNLWPETGDTPNPKDRVENAANDAVCAGRMSLATAQQKMATDWIEFGQELT